MPNDLTFLDFFSNIQRLDILVNKELPVRRREARLKVDQLKQDRLMLQVLLNVYNMLLLQIL